MHTSGSSTCLLVALALLSLTPGFAEHSEAAQTRSSIVGTVMDETGAVLPGATVELSSPDMVGGVLSTPADDRGAYRFIDLPPGTYGLRVTLNGFQTLHREALSLAFGTTLTIDLRLQAGAAESLIVTGETPTVDVTTAQSTVSVDRDLLMNLPTFSNQRDSNTIFELSPGSTYTAAYGSTSNHVMVDGAPMLLNAITISPNWLEEVNVVSLGATAEYGEFGGVSANLIVRSGSNDLHGLAEYRTTRPSWLSDNTGGLPASVRDRFAQNQIVARWDASAQAGGPLIKDRLHLFAGMQHLYDETQIAGAPAAGTTKWPRYVGKLTGAVSRSVKAETTYTYSKSATETWAPNTTLEAGSISEQPGHLWSGRVTWAPSVKTLFELRTNGGQWSQDVGPRPPATKAGPPPRRDAVTGISSGNASQYRLQDASRLIGGGTVTRILTGLAGDHTLKAGVEYDTQSFLTESGFAGGMSFIDRRGVPDQVTIWAGDVQEGIGTRTTLFAMDEWRIADRVTLQPGVRLGVYRGSTPSTGPIYSTSALSPRLGVAWDVGAAHRTVLRAQWGRFHAPIDTTTWSFADSRRTPTIIARVLPDGSYQEINRVTPAGNSRVDPGIAHPYMDQIFVALEHELFAELSVKVQYVHKDFRNNYAFIDTGSVFTPVEQRDPGPDNVAGTADDGDVLTVYALQNPGQAFFVQTNPDGADRQYDALQLVAQKRFSNQWQLLASYTRSSSRGAINNTNLSAAVGTGGVFANPNSAINAAGRSGLDFPHQASLRAVYHSTLLGGVTVSASHVFASGVGWSRTATFRLPQGNVNVRVAPRGTEPAAATNQLDARVEKRIPLGSRARALSVYVDVFNVLNRGFPPQTRYNEASGATFGQPLNWVEGRAVRVAGRLMF